MIYLPTHKYAQVVYAQLGNLEEFLANATDVRVHSFKSKQEQDAPSRGAPDEPLTQGRWELFEHALVSGKVSAGNMRLAGERGKGTAELILEQLFPGDIVYSTIDNLKNAVKIKDDMPEEMVFEFVNNALIKNGKDQFSFNYNQRQTTPTPSKIDFIISALESTPFGQVTIHFAIDVNFVWNMAELFISESPEDQD